MLERRVINTRITTGRRVRHAAVRHGRAVVAHGDAHVPRGATTKRSVFDSEQICPFHIFLSHTIFFLSHAQALRAHYPGESLCIFASKANASLATAALVNAEGLGWDAVSEGELLTAQRAGVPAARIVLHGNNKSRAEIQMVRHAR